MKGPKSRSSKRNCVAELETIVGGGLRSMSVVALVIKCFAKMKMALLPALSVQ